MMRAVTAGLALVGVACLAAASWIHIKATVGQVLIASAWQREQHGRVTSPWPWADTHPVAKLIVQHRTELATLIVLEGASGRTLAFGPAHDAASVLPGERGNSLIEGHRDTHFGFLRYLNVGDRVWVERANGGSTRFAVTDLRIVDSRRWRVALDAAEPRLTLVTCYPFDAVQAGGPLRFVVTADKSEDDPGAARGRDSQPGRQGPG